MSPTSAPDAPLVTEVGTRGGRSEQLIDVLRKVSITEAVSYLALLVATVVKQSGGSEAGVTVLGPIHGVLFLVFAGLVLLTRSALGWSWFHTLLALIIGSLPLGGFWLERRWLRTPEDG